MNKLFEKWNKFICEQREVKIYSTQMKIIIKKPAGAAAVIDDTLALIRAVPSITDVNSETDRVASDINKAFINVEFKFIPRSTSMETDLKAIKRDILKVSNLVLSVSPIRRMLSTLTRVQ